jgi:p-cumate 2,3-dioxygenase beta subunit
MWSPLEIALREVCLGCSFVTQTDDAITSHREIEAFLYDEAALLDTWNLDAWIALFTEDAQYIVPTTDLPDGDPRRDLVFIDDDFIRLQGRVQRLKSRHAHREYPSSRTRHFVSNTRITGTNGDEISVEASFIVYRFRDGSNEPFVGQYRYRLRRVDGALKICYRRATLDNENLRGQGAVSIII